MLFARRAGALVWGLCTLVGIAFGDMGAPLAANAPKPPIDSNVWTNARKVGIGTAADKTSKVWFSLADGIVTEVYWPQIDMAQVTDLQLLITDGSTFFHEEKK